jgi:hypothetical protein
VQSAWAASRCQDCFLAALFFRTSQRRGLKKAAVAVAHRIAIVAWHILAEHGVEYQERGGDFFDRRNPERTARKLSRRLETMGYKVTLVAPPKPFSSTVRAPSAPLSTLPSASSAHVGICRDASTCSTANPSILRQIPTSLYQLAPVVFEGGPCEER